MSETAMTLNKLAERVEQASADQQRELLIDAWLILSKEEATLDNPRWMRFRRMLEAEAYESAALSLVPEGWSRWCHDSDNGRAICRLERGDKEVGAQADTWALAILAAILRAHGGDE